MKSTIISLIIATSFGLTNAQTVYNWVGGNSGNFTTASNWTPARVNGQVTDILVFDNCSTINVQNVQQQTIGQLKVLNNTNIILSPASGNAKCLSINGSNGVDLLVEFGSSIEINGNDPKLGIFLKQNATGEIYGTIILRGTQAHYINANDVNSLVFKSGSILTQMNIGFAFTNTGNANVVVFEDGATMIIRNSNASSPFGLTSPNSKVVFNSNSTLSVQTSNADAISFNNRTYGNIVIAQNSNVTLSSNNIDNVIINNITVNNDCSFSINNTNQNNAIITIEGTITVNGNFTVSNNVSLNFVSNLDRYILGNGMHNLTNLSGNSYGSQNTNNIASEYTISQNYPNPFNASTKINYYLPVASNVTIKIYDVTGKEVMTLVNEYQNAGNYNVTFNSNEISSGAYMYKMVANNGSSEFVKTMKMIVTK